MSDPRVKLTVEDAITFLKTTKKKYDVIISEPSNPWIAGIGNLFTREFFDLSKQRITSSGLMVQWIHLYESNNEVFGLVVRTFARVFPNVSIWTTQRNDVILVGSLSPMNRDFREMERVISQPLVAKDLERVRIRHLLTLLSTQMFAPEMSKTLYPFGSSNTEEYPYLEYMAPRAFFLKQDANTPHNLDTRLKLGDTTLLVNKYLATHASVPEEYRELGEFYSDRRRTEYRLAENAFRLYLALVPGDQMAAMLYADVLERLGKREHSKAILEHLLSQKTQKIDVITMYARVLYQQYEQQSSFLAHGDSKELEKMIAKGRAMEKDSSQSFLVLQALLDYNEGRYREALKGFRMIMKLRESTSMSDPFLGEDKLLAYAAVAAVESNDIILALTYANQVLEIDSRNPLAMSVFQRVKQKTTR
jgi:tetratricopeptide (TPR) repeat protein